MAAHWYVCYQAICTRRLSSNRYRPGYGLQYHARVFALALGSFISKNNNLALKDILIYLTNLRRLNPFKQAWHIGNGFGDVVNHLWLRKKRVNDVIKSIVLRVIPNIKD